MKTPLQQLTRYILIAGLALAGSAAQAQEKIEDRLARIERLLNSSALMDMSNQQEQLRQSVQDLRGEIELLRRDLEEVKRRQHDLYVDVDRRLRQLETAPPPVVPAVQPPGPPVQTDGQQPPVAPKPDTATAPPSTGDEFGDYQAAFAILKAGRYAQAAQAFDAFLQRYPEGQYSANALYWLGESYYVVREFNRALPYFQQVLDTHADSSKRPDAMLKIGFIQFELGEMDKARATLEGVKREHPNTTAAALAEQRLLRITQAGR